ncbi:hypothetical protein JMY81_20900 [Brenneria goodwinii]|uniref:hypothetical protein n=1 Tax=Brenneria goodwinii TaxID=1109412 RepID=UPI000EF28184|nr:hypothetical protein [Brenneria goodwinii]MCG8158733.1 hypothetical protein [Brenneria goodwinii]MCG8163252.1 hypothetical protein [Brenneria goodwinii]MCG8167673.1 hypothetical protein [Brenneria goodwinii]MCG8170579.1 hypothetical protein [Brenneria goodwinii]MCG8174421.1 hypothetical protein [Brenneria goodwinii]
MDRRNLAKKIVLALGGAMAGAYVLPARSEVNQPDIKSLYSSREDLHDTISVLKFGSGEDASTAFYQAFIYLNKRGGGNLLVPNGNYKFNKSVKARIGCKISIYTSSNAIMKMTTDDDMFNITGSENAALRFFGNGEFIYDGPESNDAACVRFSSLVRNGRYASSSFEFNGRIRIRKGSNEWRYGLHLTDVRDAVLVGTQFDGMNKKNRPSRQIAVSINSKNSASVSWVISEIQINDVDTAFDINSNSTPGIEGLKFFNCDMGGVKNGIVFNNSEKYIPPQIEIFGCHINGTGKLIAISKAISIHIVGGLFYKKGTEGSFIELSSASDVSIIGVSLTLIGKESDAPGIVIYGNAQYTSGLIRISDCNLWGNGKKSPFIKVHGSIYNLSLSNSTKDTNGKWIDTSDLKLGKGTISIDTNTVRLSKDDVADLYGDYISNENGIVDLRNSIPGIVYLKNSKINGFVGGRINTEYTIISRNEIKITSAKNIIAPDNLSGAKVINMLYDGENYFIK